MSVLLMSVPLGFVAIRHRVSLGQASFSSLVILCATGALLGCSRRQPKPPPRDSVTATIKLAPCQDPSPLARARLLDIANQPLTAIISGRQPFAYTRAHVIIRYERTPGTPYFVGHLKATRLKPNFAYQLKLVGKPVQGGRRWGAFGDDAANERLGYAGRWWCDTEQQAVSDDHYIRDYQNAPAHQKHTVSGYLFIGVLVTDEHGRSSGDIAGANSYHIRRIQVVSATEDG